MSGNPIARSSLPATSAALLPGTVAALLLSVALPALSVAAGRRPLAAVNASAHWLWPEAGYNGGLHPRYTPVGAVTNAGAALMWGAVMAAALRRTGAPLPTAIGTALSAAVVDYAILPRRLSPGWEKPLPTWGVAAGFAALALGMVVGARAGRG
jgi:hypothetical protein